MIVEPKCSLSFYTLLFAQKRINLHRKLIRVVFSMVSVWTFRLWAFCFLLAGLITVSTLSFVCQEQANLIRDIQKTLESVCQQALAEELNKDSSSTGVETSQKEVFIRSTLLRFHRSQLGLVIPQSHCWVPVSDSFRAPSLLQGIIPGIGYDLVILGFAKWAKQSLSNIFKVNELMA